MQLDLKVKPMNKSVLLFLIFMLGASIGRGQNDTVNIQIACQPVQVGDTTCVSVTFSEINLFSFQFSFYFDPNAFDTGFIRNIHPQLLIDPLTFSDIDDQGGFRVLWFSQSTGDIMFDPNTPIFELCLVAGGPPGIYPLDIQNFPTQIEFSQNGGSDAVTVISEACPLEILGSGVFVDYCFSQATNEATAFVVVSGGTGPYDLTYSGPTSGTLNFTDNTEPIEVNGLAAGQYTFEVTDASGTVIGQEMVDIQNTSGDVDVDLSGNSDGPLCPGGNEGYIETLVSGGEAPYSYEWNTGAIQVTSLYDLQDGHYIVTVTDSKGCFDIDSVTFTTPPFVLDTLQLTNPDCNQDNGRLRVKATGGTSSNQDFFDYLWVNPAGDTIENISFGTGAPSTTNDLVSGLYQLTITDELGCQGSFDLVLEEARELIIDTLNFSPITCFGIPNGTITVNAIPDPMGSAVGNIVTELMSPDGSVAPGVQFNNLGPGDYTIIARDDECMSTLNFTLVDPPPFVVADSIVQDESCNVEDNGMIALTMQGGTRPYQFAWSNGGTDSVIANLNEGSYSVMVSDALGCTQQFDFTIIKANITFGIDTIQQITCPGSADGILGITGVQDGYTFQWSTGQNTNNISNLGPGTYTITVTDGACSGEASITLDDPEGISLTNVTLFPPMCAGGSDGNVDIEVTGGREPYAYSWSDGSTFRTLAQVPAGNYSVTVTDANLCSELVIDTVLIDPIGMILDFTNIDSVSCFKPNVFGPDGGAEVLVMNGVAPYDFFWESGETGTIAVGLEQGWNMVTAVDGDGCQMTDSVFIPSPLPITLDTMSTLYTPPTCNGFRDGSIQIAAQGGSPGYTFLWPDTVGPGVIGPDLTNIGAGDYLALVRDGNGCRDTLMVSLDQPEPITAFVDSINSRGETCHDSNDGQIFLGTTGRAPEDLVFIWTDDISFNNMADNLDTGLYQIIIEDTQGCPGDTLSYFLDGPAPITYTFTGDQQIDCNGETIFLNFDGITGGNVPTDYSISFNGGPAQSNNNSIEVAAGQYDLTIMDKLGCTIDTSILITEPPAIGIQFIGTDSLNLGDSTRINVLVAGGNGVFVDYSWDKLDDLNCMDSECLDFIATPTQNMTYTLTVTDSSGCMVDEAFVITVNQKRLVYIPNVFSPNGDGENDFFRLYTGSGVRSITYLRIFDRWGNLVYDEDNVTPSFGGTEGWDGRSITLENAEPGVYVYATEVEFIDGRKLIYRGSVTLVR